MPDPLIVGISGRKRSGKDTLCGYLSDALTARGLTPHRVALADALKDDLACLLGTKAPGFARGALDDERRKETLRPLMQAYGVALRDLAGEDYWVRRAEARVWLLTHHLDGATVPGRHVVLVPDVRFVNEAEWVTSRGGVLLRVLRAGLEGDAHVSETEMETEAFLRHVYGTLFNAGDLTDLGEEAGVVLGWLEKDGLI